MQVFLSWSGDKSQKVAEAFEGWLPKIISGVKPWLSTRDIPTGALWMNETRRALTDSDYGIIFITKENYENKWILFEAGALASDFEDNRVFVYLIDIEANSLEASSPLFAIQATKNDKDSVFRMICALKNDKANEEDSTIEARFDQFWKGYDSKVRLILKRQGDSNHDTKTIPDIDYLKNIYTKLISLEQNPNIDFQKSIYKKLISLERNIEVQEYSYISKQLAREKIYLLQEKQFDSEEIHHVMTGMVPERWLEKQLVKI